jgi:hypothetical protein
MRLYAAKTELGYMKMGASRLKKKLLAGALVAFSGMVGWLVGCRECEYTGDGTDTEIWPGLARYGKW